MDGQGTKWHTNIAKNFSRLNTVHKRYRRQTGRRQTDGRQHIANVSVNSRSLKTNCVGTWATMWHRLHNRLNPVTQIISFYPMIIFCSRNGGSLLVDLTGGGVSVSCPGIEGSEKMPSTVHPLGIFTGTALSLKLQNFQIVQLMSIMFSFCVFGHDESIFSVV